MVTKAEFSRIFNLMVEATQAKDVTAKTSQAYYHLLSDLDSETLLAAVKAVLAQHEFVRTLPAIGKIRKAMTNMIMGKIAPSSAAEAWELARRAVRGFGYYQESRGLNSLPYLVAKATRCIGWQTLCDMEKPEYVYRQFAEAYEAFARKEAEMIQSFGPEAISPAKIPKQIDSAIKGVLEKWEKR